jgi:hypothetical protein
MGTGAHHLRHSPTPWCAKPCRFLRAFASSTKHFETLAPAVGWCRCWYYHAADFLPFPVPLHDICHHGPEPVSRKHFLLQALRAATDGVNVTPGPPDPSMRQTSDWVAGDLLDTELRQGSRRWTHVFPCAESYAPLGRGCLP